MPAASGGRILPDQAHHMSHLGHAPLMPDNIGLRMRGRPNGQSLHRPRYDNRIVLTPRHTLHTLRENAPKVILPDMNLGGISSTPEDDGMTTGGGGKSTDGRSNASVSPSSQPPDVSPPTPCDMRVEAMVEGEDAAEPTSREGGQESSQEDARAAEVGRRRRASGDDKSRAELPMDVGASASTAGAMGGRGASPRQGG